VLLSGNPSERLCHYAAKLHNSIEHLHIIDVHGLLLLLQVTHHQGYNPVLLQWKE
jgi:hypothetical protein